MRKKPCKRGNGVLVGHNGNGRGKSGGGDGESRDRVAVVCRGGGVTDMRHDCGRGANDVMEEGKGDGGITRETKDVAKLVKGCGVHGVGLVIVIAGKTGVVTDAKLDVVVDSEGF